jgi:hypothetical protein
MTYSFLDNGYELVEEAISNDMADLLGYGDMKPNGGGMTSAGVAEIAQKAGVSPDQVDPEVAKNITKDYRELMSKMNNK